MPGDLPRMRPWMWHIGNTLASVVRVIRFRTRLHVTDVLPQGGVLLCAKHASGFDIPFLAFSVWRLLRKRPYFQMGSFVGYPVLGRLRPLLVALGGFPVMRPKEVRRLLRRRGWDRGAATARMAAVNAGAGKARRAILSAGGVLVVFPEGTRDGSTLRPLTSRVELQSALEVARQGRPVSVWPVVLSYGARRGLRRPARVTFHEPFLIRGDEDPREVLARLTRCFEESWRPPGGLEDDTT